MSARQSGTTDFGYQQITTAEKTGRVSAVFSSVAAHYDLMNDLMSFGMHRLWKRQAVYIANIRPDAQIVDLAAGTADMTLLMQRQLSASGHITLCDINPDMLCQGRARLLDQGIINGIDFVQGNAECLPFEDNHFDLVMIAFGLRNITDKDRALSSIYAKLKFGGSLLILEFSKPLLPFLSHLYDLYSFNIIPWLGRKIADDEASYRYLVESIRRHPDQITLAQKMEATGFDMLRYLNLSNGIVTIHRGYKL